MPLLSWIGRQRTRAVAAVVFVALVTPGIGQLLKPYLTPTVIALLVIAFLRMDLAACKAHLRRPALVVAATLWTTLAVPGLALLLSRVFRLDEVAGVFTGVMMQSVASPMMAAPALVALLGLDATLILVTLIASTAMVPVTAPILVEFMELEIALAPAALGFKLGLILTVSAIGGLVLRQVLSAELINRNRNRIDGVNILILYVFAAAVMTDVAAEMIARPLLVLGLLALTLLVTGLLLLVTFCVFYRSGHQTALALALMTSLRNMGLMLAGASGAVPGLTWLYIAIAQFPIHLAPLLLGPVAKRLERRASQRQR